MNHQLINPQDARIFRITHINNLPWLLDHGLHCQSAPMHDPKFVPIGMNSLIHKRRAHPVPVGPGGVLGDYVPFYFTPWSMMMMNIQTGYNGVIRRSNSEIVILGARLPVLLERGLKVIFTDGHAYMAQTHFFEPRGRLDQIDWAILQARDFSRSEDDPDKSRRYQAEALVHRHLPIDAIAAIGCNDVHARRQVDQWVGERNLSLRVLLQPDWYF